MSPTHKAGLSFPGGTLKTSCGLSSPQLEDTGVRHGIVRTVTGCVVLTRDREGCGCQGPFQVAKPCSPVLTTHTVGQT